MNIGFIGLGKLGLDCAEVFAEHYTVFGYDIYPRESNSVQICDTVKQLVENSDWIFVAVQTPHAEGYDGSVPSSHMEPRDFGHDAVKDAIGYINAYANNSKRVVLISTVLPGTTRREFATLLDKQHQFLYNPYLIAMGSVKWDMVNPEMIMIGTETGDPDEMSELIDIYRPMMKNNPRYVTGTWDECEAIKIFYNTFISAKVGLANMIQDFAIKIGNIDVDVVTNALAQSTMRIMGPKYMTAGMGDAGACHPRDNIALRYMADELNLGYDLFDSIMEAREIQARNIALELVKHSKENAMQIVIHGKAYKPNVEYCDGSYSLLIGHYCEEQGHTPVYVDPLTGDNFSPAGPAVFLLAHSASTTYKYTGKNSADKLYCNIPNGSIVVDPWRNYINANCTVVHYGNTRS